MLIDRLSERGPAKAAGHPPRGNSTSVSGGHGDVLELDTGVGKQGQLGQFSRHPLGGALRTGEAPESRLSWTR